MHSTHDRIRPRMRAVASFLALLCALVHGPRAVASDDPPTARSLVWATLTIGADGLPTRVAFPDDQDLSAALKAELGPRLARAEFEPVVIDGIPREGITPARVTLEVAGDGASRSVRIVDVTPMARPLRRLMPHYPPRALQRGIEGEVVLRCTVGDDGTCSEVSVLEGPRFRDFAAAAEKALRQWRFQPQTVEGESTSVLAVPFGFRLYGSDGTRHADFKEAAAQRVRFRMSRSPVGMR